MNKNFKNGLISVSEGIWSMVPLIGSPSQTAVSTFLSNQKFQNIEDFNKRLSQDLKSLNNQVNEINYVTSNLTEIVESIYEDIEKTRMSEKRAFYSKALANSIIRDKSSSLAKEKYFIQILSIIPLDYINELENILKYGKPTISDYDTGWSTFLTSYGLINKKLVMGAMTYGPAPYSYEFSINETGEKFLEFICTLDNNVD